MNHILVFYQQISPQVTFNKKQVVTLYLMVIEIYYVILYYMERMGFLLCMMGDCIGKVISIDQIIITVLEFILRIFGLLAGNVLRITWVLTLTSMLIDDAFLTHDLLTLLLLLFLIVRQQILLIFKIFFIFILTL